VVIFDTPRVADCYLVAGALKDREAVRKVIEDADAVIYNIGILREYPHQGITFQELQFEGAARAADLAVECGARRFILMSANGVELAATKYQCTKLAAEDYVKKLDLDWTVMRPSVIFGNPQGKSEFASMLRRDIIASPLPAPLFYTGLWPVDAGSFELSPVHVRDVADAFVRALEEKATFRRTFTLGGPRTLSWKDILLTISRAIGKRKLMLPVPAFGPSMAAALFDRFPWFPISRDQIRMLMVGNQCRGDEIFDLLGIEAEPFNPANLQYLSAKPNSASPAADPMSTSGGEGAK